MKVKKTRGQVLQSNKLSLLKNYGKSCKIELAKGLRLMPMGDYTICRKSGLFQVRYTTVKLGSKEK